MKTCEAIMMDKDGKEFSCNEEATHRAPSGQLMCTCHANQVDDLIQKTQRDGQCTLLPDEGDWTKCELCGEHVTHVETCCVCGYSYCDNCSSSIALYCVDCQEEI
jgi:hypothetical protein